MQKENLINLIDTTISFFDPLVQALEDTENTTNFLNELGYDPPVDADAFQEFRILLENLLELIHNIDDSLDAKDKSEYVKLFLDIIQSAPEIANAVKNLENSINTFFPNDFIVSTNIVQNLPGQIINYLTIHALKERVPVMHSVLLIMGIIEENYVEQSNSYTKSYYKKEIKWSRIGDYFSNPIDAVHTAYNWDDPAIAFEKALNNLNVLGKALNLYSEINKADPDTLKTFNNGIDVVLEDNLNLLKILKFPLLREYTDALGLEIYPYLNAQKDGATGFGIGIYFDPSDGIEIPISDNLTFKIKYSENKEFNTGLLITKDGTIQIINNVYNTDINADFSLTNFVPEFIYENKDEATVIFETSFGAKLQFKSWAVRMGFNEKSALYVETDLQDVSLVLSSKDGDGFIQKILPAESMHVDFDLVIGFSTNSGLYFRGSSALEIQLPVHIELGPIELESATIALKPKDGGLPCNFGATIRGKLGPLEAVIENVGLTIDTSFPDNDTGNFGLIDINSSFKPPNGAGLSIDADVVKGAGYLYIDTDRDEYAGVLELTFSDFLSLKAIGLIATKMPDGSKGFSLLIIITAEFTIQLGMGFVFLGAGGLLGLHRTAKLTPLAEGVRSGATANILFPTNVVENAAKIISDIRVFFPIEQNHFLIGPMIKLGWGQPALINLSLGIIIEIKTNEGGNLERIAILGVVKCILPEEKTAILMLQVNFIGAVDFTTQTGFFFASIFESRVLTFTLEGEMGLLVAWGDNSNFLVSVGGFHPRFSPPPLPFPLPKRVAISILNKSWGKIRLEGYFAITTNTVQFGSKIEVRFKFSEFRIEGYLAFDALFQFDPFYFIVEISGKVSLKVFGAGLFSITARFSLEGPTPWRAKGYGKVKILFVTFKARFDKKWGTSKNTTLPPIEVMPILEKEFGASPNWEAIPPAFTHVMVTLRDLSGQDDGTPDIIALHPGGKIRISQRAVPFIKIDKVGNQKPSDANHFSLDAPSAGFAWGNDVKESFAPGQYLKKSSSELLSEKATRKYNAGALLHAADEEINSHHITVRHVRYELTTIDTAYKRTRYFFFRGILALFRVLLRNNATARSALSRHVLSTYEPFEEKITVQEGSFTVANMSNNKPYMAEATFNNQWEAETFLANQVMNNPEMEGELHIIPSNEVNPTAI